MNAFVGSAQPCTVGGKWPLANRLFGPKARLFWACLARGACLPFVVLRSFRGLKWGSGPGLAQERP